MAGNHLDMAEGAPASVWTACHGGLVRALAAFREQLDLANYKSIGGPVLKWELVRQARRPVLRLVAFLYLVWLFGQLLAYKPSDPAVLPFHNFGQPVLTRMEIQREALLVRMAFAANFEFKLLLQHL